MTYFVDSFSTKLSLVARSPARLAIMKRSECAFFDNELLNLKAELKFRSLNERHDISHLSPGASGTRNQFPTFFLASLTQFLTRQRGNATSISSCIPPKWDFPFYGKDVRSVPREKVDSEVTRSLTRKTRYRNGVYTRDCGVPYAAPVRRSPAEASGGVGQRDSGCRKPDVPRGSAAAPASGPRADTTAPCDASCGGRRLSRANDGRVGRARLALQRARFDDGTTKSARARPSVKTRNQPKIRRERSTRTTVFPRRCQEMKGRKGRDEITLAFFEMTIRSGVTLFFPASARSSRTTRKVRHTRLEGCEEQLRAITVVIARSGRVPRECDTALSVPWHTCRTLCVRAGRARRARRTRGGKGEGRSYRRYNTFVPREDTLQQRSVRCERAASTDRALRRDASTWPHWPRASRLPPSFPHYRPRTPRVTAKRV